MSLSAAYSWPLQLPAFVEDFIWNSRAMIQFVMIPWTARGGQSSAQGTQIKKADLCFTKGGDAKGNIRNKNKGEKLKI